MPTPDLSKFSGPIGPLRDKYTQEIGSEDFTLDKGFVCQVAATGTIKYRTLNGTKDQSETITTVGTVINVAGVPVVLKTIRGDSTVTSVVVGARFIFWWLGGDAGTFVAPSTTPGNALSWMGNALTWRGEHVTWR